MHLFQFVDLAALSMSGSLMPSVPTQFLLKFNPPKLTIVYHFVRNDKEKYYHEVLIEKHMLQTMSNEDIASHLFVAEAYYFDPKQIPRKQVISIVQRLKDGYQQQLKNQQKLQQTNQNQTQNQQNDNEQNFFQKKRSINFEVYSDDFIEEPQFDMVGNSAAANPVNDSKIGPFVQNIAPSHSPQVNDLANNHYDNNSNFINHQNEEDHIPMMYSQQPPSVFVNINNSNQVAAQSAVSATQNQVRNNAHSNAHDDLMDIIDFESEKSLDHQENAANNPFSQQQHNQQIMSGSGEMNNQNLLDIYDDDENNGNIDHYDNSQVDINNNISQQNISQNHQNDMSNGGNGGNVLGDEEEESVYIKDNIVMRRIQIEGEEQEFLMDPDGNIYDMNGNFIGTANANDLEEVDDDGAADNGNDDDEGGHEEQLIL
eukprot:403346527